MSTSVFDKAAGEWDEDAPRLARALAHARAILSVLLDSGVAPAASVLDFGAGTGTLSISLAAKAAGMHLTLLDRSRGMAEQARAKAEAAGLADRVSVVCEELEMAHPAHLGGRTFDACFSTLTFHHVADPRGVAALLFSYLNEGGVICILDMVTQDDSVGFHAGAPPEQVADVKQHGFSEQELQDVLRTAGFRDTAFAEGPLSVKANGSFRMGIWTGKKITLSRA